MRSSDSILRQVRRALTVVFLLAGVGSVLIAGLALHALALLPRDLGLPTPQQLGLLAASAGAIVAALLCISAARERILQRAGLWLDHTLAQQLLQGCARSGMPANALKGDAGAIARVRDCLMDRAVMPLLEAPWSVLLIGAIAFMHPLLAVIAALSAAVLLVIAAGNAASIGRLEQKRLRAAERVAAWWRRLAPAPLTADAAEEWERLNCHHVAAAYALDRHLLIQRDAAHAVRAVSLIGTIAAGTWLIAAREITPGGLLAAIVLQVCILKTLVAVVTSLKSVRRALLDYRRLADAPEKPAPRPVFVAYGTEGANAPSQQPTLPVFTAPIPELRIGGPVALGFGAAALLLAVGTVAAGLLPPQDLAGLIPEGRLSTQAVAVRHAKGGVAARVHVMRGTEVKAGDPLVSLDTTLLDRQLASLRQDADAARAELDAAAREAAELASLNPPTLADRAKLAQLDERMAKLRQRTETMPHRIAVAELDVARSVIRAPVSGRVVALGVRTPNDAILAGSTVAEIASDTQPTLLDRMSAPLWRTVERVLRSLQEIVA